jgi:hypothetical protein
MWYPKGYGSRAGWYKQSVGGGVSTPNAPVLAMSPVWTSADNKPDFLINLDSTVVAGDTIHLQIQLAGGDWSNLVSDTTYTVPSGTSGSMDFSNVDNTGLLVILEDI